MPVGFSENLFALHAEGWGFNTDSIHRTGVEGSSRFDVEIELAGERIDVEEATAEASLVVSTSGRTARVGGGGDCPFRVVGYKYLSGEDIASVVLDLFNPGPNAIQVRVSASAPIVDGVRDRSLVGSALGFDVMMAGERFAVLSDRSAITRDLVVLPQTTTRLRLGLAFGSSLDECGRALSGFFADPDPVATQRTQFRAWFDANIPFFFAPDREFLRTYYFRWLTYRNHLRRTRAGSYVVTEFLPYVPWATANNAIAAAAGHHLYEGRWIRDPRYLDDYERFWMSGVDRGPYSQWMADAYVARHNVLGHIDLLADDDLLSSLIDQFHEWERKATDETGLYYIADNPDAMENSISGPGPDYRPTVNSYAYGNAMAIASIAHRLGRRRTASKFRLRAEAIRARTVEELWDDDAGFFTVKNKSTGKSAGVREQLGYIPWYFGLPPDESKYGQAWLELTDPQGFLAPYGPTTAERRHPGFTQRTEDVDCEWNGPSWPFATSQTLTGLARLLHEDRTAPVTRETYFELLQAYAASHRRCGHPWVAENLHADTGEWIADSARSVHYNHSTFADLVITGLVGLRPDSSETLLVDPLLPPTTWDYFALTNVTYHGHEIAVVWDRDGSRYGCGSGLMVYVDGRLRETRTELSLIEVDLSV